MNGAIPKTPGSHQLEMTAAGETRSYLLHIPPGFDASIQTPLVIVLHGATGTGKRISVVSGFNETAERHGFVIAYPDGAGGYWNDGRETAGQADDVGFISALIDLLTPELNIDPNRIYVSGISNGAMMTLRLACELSGKIAAIAPVAGTMPESIALVCVPEYPVPVIMFHGTEDTFLPYQGGELGGRAPATMLSVSRTAETWAELNGCDTKPKTTIFPVRDPSDGTQVRLDAYSGSEPGAEVHLYTIYGGGHTWPAGRNSQLLNLGRTSREIRATDVIWEFFSRHKKITMKLTETRKDE